MTNAWQLGVKSIAALVQSKQRSPLEVVTALLERSASLDPALHAWVTLDADGALAAAAALDRRLAQGQMLGPLAGVPVAVKDIIDVAGLPTTASSRVLAGNVAKADAACVERLRRADAIILGKAETSEFAGPDPAPTRNPWNAAHTPGGSSSGSAVAVAAGLAPGALGSQTGGSTVRPAAYNGIVGLKPTYGAISSRGMIPLAWSFDHVGVLARSVEDVATMLDALVGHDALDPSSSPRADRYRAPRVPRSERPIIGFLRDPFFDLADPTTQTATTGALERLASAGAEIRDISIRDPWDQVQRAGRIVFMGELYAYHREQWEAVRDLYRPMLAVLVQDASKVSVADYALALRRLPAIAAELDAALQGVDAALTPATPGPPPDVSSTGDASFQTGWSFSGLPTIALPTGIGPHGLPTAIQLVGRRWEDGKLLAVAQWCEQALQFDAWPPCYGTGR